jgi:hypothetical protein
MARIPTVGFAEVREFYARTHPEGYWFEPASMRFFKTKLPAIAYETAAGLLFITSEVNPSGEKRYSIRRQEADGNINTVGEFHSFGSRATALAEVNRLHKEFSHA